MTVSPAASNGVNAMMVLSVIAPAGTINHTTRGACSCGHQRLEGGRGLPRPFASTTLASRLRRIEPDDLVTATHQPLRHVGAHAAQTNHRNLHSFQPWPQRPAGMLV